MTMWAPRSVFRIDDHIVYATKAAESSSIIFATIPCPPSPVSEGLGRLTNPEVVGSHKSNEDGAANAGTLFVFPPNIIEDVGRESGEAPPDSFDFCPMSGRVVLLFADENEIRVIDLL